MNEPMVLERAPIRDADASASAEARSVAKEGGWAGFLGLLGAGIRYGNNIILTRLLGARFYGLYALANTVVTVVMIPASLGLPTSMVHFLASSSSTGQWGKLRWITRRSILAALLSSLVGMGVVLALAPLASGFLFRKKGLLPGLVGLSLALPFLVLYMVHAGGLQGLKRIRAKVFIERIAHPLIFIVILLVGWFFFRSDPFVLALVGFGVAAAAVFAISAFWFRRQMAAVPKGEGQEPSHWRELVSFSAPVMFMNLLGYFVLKSDVLVMGTFRTAAEVGVYAIAAALAQGVSMPTDALGASLAPSFSGLMGQGDVEGLRRLFHTSTRWLFLMGSFVGLALILAGKLILHLFGKDFSEGFLVLCVLASGQMFSACLGANGNLITMTGHPKVNLVNSLCLGLGNLSLGILLVPRYGAMGAAAASATSWVFVNLARALEIWFILKIGPWDKTIRKPLVTVAASALAGGAGYHWIQPIAGAAIGLGLFVLLWKLLGPEPEDWDLAQRLLQRLRGKGR